MRVISVVRPAWRWGKLVVEGRLGKRFGGQPSGRHTRWTVVWLRVLLNHCSVALQAFVIE